MSQFDPKKDYYAILGVMPDAEDVVITAAYRALVSRYHPDRWNGDPSIAHTRTAEINEAYSVLGDKKLKSEYDELREKTSAFEESNSQASEIDAALAEMEDRWQVAVDIYPDLSETRQRLMKTAHRLAFSYVVLLLESKKFKERNEIARAMEKHFLELHFGKNEEIIKFAKQLINYGFKDAIKALNKTIDVIGDNIDAEPIIQKIKNKFDVDTKIRNIRAAQTKNQELDELTKLKKLVRERQWESDAIQLIRDLGYRLVTTRGGLFSSGTIIITDPKTNETLYSGRSTYEMIQWVVANLATQ